MKSESILNLPKSEHPVITRVTEENKHTFPKLMQNLFEATSKDKNWTPLGTKYFKTQEAMLRREVSELYVKQPDLPLIKVLLSMLQGLPDFLPADNLIHVTEFVLKEWKKLQEEPDEKKREILLVSPKIEE